MKFLTWSINLLLCSFFFSVAAWSASIEGTVVRDPKGVFLKVEQSPGDPSSSVIFTLNSPSTSTLIQIGRLEDGDLVSAGGVLDYTSRVALINSIEYVGLKKLLGRWYTSDRIFEFSSFTDLHLYKPNPPNVTNFRYSTAPSSGNDWTLFLSDTNNKRTVLATIRFSKTAATLKLIDSETGGIAETIRLTRRGAKDVKFDPFTSNE